MGFVLDGLDTESYDRQYGDRVLLSRIVNYFAPHKGTMILVAVMIALNSIAGTGGPIIISRAIDLIAENPTRTVLYYMVAGVFLLGASAWGFNFIRQLFSARILGDVVLKLREDVYESTINHELSFYSEHSTGKIVSRVTSDTQDFSQVVSLSLNLMSQIVLVILLSIWLFSINPMLTLVMWSMSPVAVAIALGFRKIARNVTRNARRVTAKINSQIQESISGITIAKSFRQEDEMYSRFSHINKQSFRVGLKRGFTMGTIFPVMGLSSGLGIAVLIYAGALASRSGTMSSGEWFLFMQGVGFFWWPMMGIASFWSQFQDGLAAAERVFALIDMEPEVRQIDSKTMKNVKGAIEFDRVQFGYKEDVLVLPELTLSIKPAETVALVGHTGAGKTSIARLVSRFYEYQEGELLIDGMDIREIELAWYRKHLGIVPQEPFLFSDTVMENIRFGLPGATDEMVCQAAENISGGDWLADLPEGLETQVGERGSNLSQGQRQLVALARVLLKSPAIFILDEATASVDPFTEAQIQDGLETIMSQRTAIVIAHRLSTIKNADRILVMRDGRIIEEGSHDQLISEDGHYAELYNTYYRHQSLEFIEAKRWQQELDDVATDFVVGS
ncbi:MAG: ABC transporter ATP-binding protein [Chloroflexota bacterium]